MAEAVKSRPFILPDLGEGLTEAEIVNWLVAPGDTVAIDQPVVEVESAKSIVELPSPFAGVVETLHAAVGATVHAGEPLLTIGGGADAGGAAADGTDAGAAGAKGAAAGGAGPDTVPGTALRGDPAAAVASASAAEGSGSEGSGAVLIGYGTRERTRSTRAVPVGRFGKKAGTVASSNVAAPPAASAAAPPTGMAATAPSPSPRKRVDDVPPPSGLSPVVSPLVRRLARDHGFEAHNLAGTGPNGLVLRADVEQRIAGASGVSTPQGASTTQPAPIASADGDLRIPLTGLRKVVADRMSASRREVPEATIWLDVDATALLEAKEQLQRSTGERWSINALIARFVVAGLKQWPILNSSIDTVAGEIVQHSRINLGLAAQTGRGLMVPVVHDAGSMTTAGLRDAISALVETAASGAFPNDQLRGGTFTLNNYGGFGVDGSAPIINQPEVAMLGVGRIMDRPWVVDGQLAVRKVVFLSMVFDHRVCDGDVPSEFIGFVARCIENPIALLGEL
ncbi:2-oxo acid dehydrogenase subunit E2 [Leifsonia bigeumensis]|uniref:Dihydrolipoamide acetyltransferase component of pyruvate dehydrogenase complex n=1 Tax=Leifsonella bigeumensis TaxID=433643 RepID=A0ABP7FTU6_9MICO